jgi:hypothetical protein
MSKTGPDIKEEKAKPEEHSSNFNNLNVILPFSYCPCSQGKVSHCNFSISSSLQCLFHKVTGRFKQNS